MKPRLDKTLERATRLFRTPKRKAHPARAGQRRKEPTKQDQSFSLRRLCAFAPLCEFFFFQRGKRIFSGLLALVLLHCALDLANAQPFSTIPNQIPVGTRPRSMGEAFVAVADDGHAPLWNPAGLMRREGLRLTFAHADLYGLGLKHNFLSVTYRFGDYLAFGGYGVGLDAGGNDFEYSQEQFGLSFALRSPFNWRMLRALNLGVNLKYLQNTQALKNPDTREFFPEGDYGGVGFDAGVLYALDEISFLPKGFSVGLMLHDLGDTEVTHHDTDFPEPLHRQRLRLGMSYRPFEKRSWKGVSLSEPLLAVDLDDRLHVGVEMWFAKMLAVRGGLQKELRGEERGATFSIGVGFKQNLGEAGRRIEVDYGYANTPVLPNTAAQFGGALVLNENPRSIRIESAEINDVFASLYKHYAYAASDSAMTAQAASLKAGELGRVVLKNLFADSLIVKLTFKAEPYTKNPVPQTVVVPGNNGIKEVSLRAFLEANILTAPARDNMTAEITATYILTDRGEYKTTKAVEYTLHGPGFLTWDDPAKAAAFVTKYDACLNHFAKSAVTQETQEEKPAVSFSRNVEYALKLYEALNALDYRWVSDATTPFYKVGRTKQVPDQIRYPADLLADSSRAGDCDDLAVLYASLLESVGVQTALLVTPTHVFMMLNTDIPARRLSGMAVGPKKFFAHRGALWLPVETTLFPVSFAEAWHEGALKAHEAFAGDSLQIVDVGVHQTPKGYEPANVRFACKTAAPHIGARATSNLAALADTARRYLVKFEDDLRRDPGDKKRRNEYAVVLGQNGERQKARLELTRVRAQDPKYAPALNNLGNLALLEDRYAEAETLYEQALLHNAYNKAGTYLNLAFLYAMQSDTNAARNAQLRAKCREALENAGRWLNYDSTQAALLLGLSPDMPRAKGAKQQEGDKPKTPEQRLMRSDSTRAAPDSIRYTPQDDSGMLKKTLQIFRFIGNAMGALLEGRAPDDVMLNWAAPKGTGDAEEDRARLLWWETQGE